MFNTCNAFVFHVCSVSLGNIQPNVMYQRRRNNNKDYYSLGVAHVLGAPINCLKLVASYTVKLSIKFNKEKLVVRVYV